jgi:hypothetical protein
MGSQSGRDTAIELLIGQPERLEPGLVVLEKHLRLDEHAELDVLLCDRLGYPVIVLFSGEDVTGELGRMAAVVAALQRGRHLLERLFGKSGMDCSLRPRFVLLANRFPDNAPALLDMLSGVEVQALEYKVVTGSDGTPMLALTSFHRTPGPPLGSSVSLAPSPRTPRARTRPATVPAADRAPKPEPETLTRPASPAAAPSGAGPSGADEADVSDETDLHLIDDTGSAPEVSRGYFLRARDSIRSLSSQVVESSTNGKVRYHVGKDLLATLLLDNKGFRVQIGAKKGAGVNVKTEEAFNERLNSIFTLYFDTMGSGRTSA